MKKKLITLTIFGTLLFASISAFSLKENTVRASAAIDITDYSACDYAHTSHNATGLLKALRTITSPGHAGSYDALWTTYGKVYTRPDGKIFDYYSKITNYDPVKDRAGNYSKEGDVFNREHSIPKDWWGGAKSNQGADPFIVVPTDGYVNNRRSAYSFGMVDRSSITYAASGNFAYLGTAVSSWGYSGTVFEPDDSLKGDFARIMFYAIAKYSGSAKWTSGNGSSNFSGSESKNHGLTDYAVKLFSYWSNFDPVSDWERKINDGIAGIQGNRNPFIDHPEYANTLWGSNDGYTPYQEEEPELESIAVVNPKDEYYIDEEFVKPTVMAYYSNGASENVKSKATFTGFDNTTTGVKTVNVTYLDKTTSYEVEIFERPLELTVSTQQIEIKEEEMSSFTFSTNKDATVSWSIDNPYLASLSKWTGSTVNVTGIKAGNTNIRVVAETDKERDEKTIRLIVSEKPVYIDLELTVSKQNIEINTQETASFTYSTNKQASVTWSIDDQTIASLSEGENGAVIVTGLKEGTATITVTAATESETDSKTISLTVNKGPEPTPPTPPAPAAKGCGGNIATTSIVLSSLALAGIIAVVIVSITRKKKSTSK